MESSHTAGGYVKSYSYFGKQCQFLKSLNTELLDDLAIPLLGIYPKETKTYVDIKTCTQMFITALFIRAKK